MNHHLRYKAINKTTNITNEFKIGESSIIQF